MDNAILTCFGIAATIEYTILLQPFMKTPFAFAIGVAVAAVSVKVLSVNTLKKESE